MYEVRQIDGTVPAGGLHVASFLCLWQAEKWAVEQNSLRPETIFHVLTEEGAHVSTIGMITFAHALATWAA